MELDPLLISRLQFAFTIIFHIIFPTFTIGLSAYIANSCYIVRGAAAITYKYNMP